jgi:transcriptional regulator EpsA
VENDDILIRTRADLDVLLVNLEAGAKVKRRPDFFSWVQGVFQGVLAHEVLICVVADAPARSYRTDWMSSLPVDEERYAELCERGSGFVFRVMAVWEQLGRRPLLLNGRIRPSTSDFGLGPDIERLGLINVLAHGIPDLDGRAAGFFSFSRIGAPLTERHLIALDLMVPQLYAAWVRVCSEEGRREFPPPPSPREILTGREIEILNWVEQGKSNNEIAQILQISHLTVKNHVQKILRKLNVQNRAQAVAKGISLNLTNGR